MTRLEYEEAQRGFVEQVARRLELDPSGADVAGLLEQIGRCDPGALDVLSRFCEAYSAWFEATDVIPTLSDPGEIEAARDVAIEAISTRVAARRALIAYLDSAHPRGPRGKPGDDINVLAGISSRP